MWRGGIWMFVESGFAEPGGLCMVLCGVGCFQLFLKGRIGNSTVFIRFNLWIQ